MINRRGRKPTLERDGPDHATCHKGRNNLRMAVAESSSCGRSTVFLFLLIVFISFIIISKTIISETKVLDQYFTTDDGVNTLRRTNSSRFNANRCSRILLYDTELVSKDTGASYTLASTVAATTDSALVLLEPPLDDKYNKWMKFGGSPFGCPASSNESCDRLPTGLSRIVHVPEILSQGCDVPMNLTCTIDDQNNQTFTIQSYQDWSRISNQTIRRFGFKEVRCNHHNDSSNIVTVLAIGGYQLKYYWINNVRPRLVQRFLDESNSTKLRRMKWEQWIEGWSTRMGVTMEEVHEYTRANNIINNKKKDGNSSYVEEYSLLDYLLAVLNRAEVPMFQPWVVKDIASYMQKIHLPQSSSPNQSLLHNAGGGYDAMHVRRGDSLTTGQSIRSAEEYWVQQGYPARHNKTNDIATLSMYPTNFVPWVRYWEQFIAYNSNCNLQNNNLASVRKVYIATDDINTVKSEIANLTSTHGQQFWTVCGKSVEFIFNPQEEHATHLHHHLAPNTRNGGNTTNGHDQYSRALTALVDLHILARSHLLVGDGRSFVTRLLWMLRTSFQDDHPHTRDIAVTWGINAKQPPWK